MSSRMSQAPSERLDAATCCQRLRGAGLAADEADNLVTADLTTRRLALHENAVWMLRVIAGK